LRATLVTAGTFGVDLSPRACVCPALASADMTTGQASDSSARASATSFSDVTNALTASRAQIGDDVEPSPDARQSAKWRERQRVQTGERVVPSRRMSPAISATPSAARPTMRTARGRMAMSDPAPDRRADRFDKSL
jgi:hypothetical protein